MLAVNRSNVMSLFPYLVGGGLMWFFMLKSGVHATIAGVLTAFTIPFTHKTAGEQAPSDWLENLLHGPVAFLILPIFALANTGIMIGGDWAAELASANGMGIILGLIVGKPVGIMLLSFVVVSMGICRLPLDLSWKHIAGAGMLGGIGFTMSIFITNLAFAENVGEINASKMAVLLASLASGTAGFVWLKLLGKPKEDDTDMDTMDFDDDNGDEAQ